MLDVVSPRRPKDPPWRSRHAHRSLDPAVARLLTYARVQRGWSYDEAALAVGISDRYLRYLEAGQRVPSTAVAERLIDAYQVDDWDSELVRAAALADVGLASPFRRGWRQPQRERAAARAAADLAPLLVQVEVAALASDLPRGVRRSPYG